MRAQTVHIAFSIVLGTCWVCRHVYHDIYLRLKIGRITQKIFLCLQHGHSPQAVSRLSQILYLKVAV